ncbi:Multidrug resistance-associated protein 1 [Chamberlinius hualienensis]
MHHMEEFCGGKPFWDIHLTWNTTNPDFTECFQQTVLTWIPCALLWLTSPIEIYILYRSRNQKIPWTILNIAKTVVCGILVLLAGVQLCSSVYRISSDIYVPPVEFFTPAFKLVTFILILIFTICERKRGVMSSGYQFFFWLVSLITGAAIYRSFLMKAFDSTTIVDEMEFTIGCLYYPLIIMQFVLSCVSDAKPFDAKAQEDGGRKPCPELTASFPSWLFFSWFDGMAYLGYKKDLQSKDLWLLNSGDLSKNLFPHFDRHLQKEMKKLENPVLGYSCDNNADEVKFLRQSQQKARPNITKLLFKSFGWLYVLGTFLKLVSDLFLFVNPTILDMLIDYVGSDEPLWKGLLYACLMLATSVINLVLMGRSSHFVYLVSMRIRSTLIATVYRKALRLSNSARKRYTLGDIVNLMAVDVQRLADVAIYFNLIWTAPVQISVALYLLWQRLGVAILSGIGILILLNIVTLGVVGYAKKLQASQMKFKDHRIKLMNEILNGIKVLKLYAWEKCFMDLVKNIRSQEVVVLRKAAYFGISMTFTWMSSGILVCVSSFATYVLMDSRNGLDPNKAFVSMSLFSIMQTPIMLMPMVILSMVQATVAIKRICEFLVCEEIDPDNVKHVHNEKYPLLIENGSFSWDIQEDPVLDEINLRVRRNSLVAVVGPVGAGKSSLISAILGEMEKLNGRLFVNESVAYVPQQAWMQNATLQNNILFGKSLRSAFYETVIDACALKPDLQILPARDQTEIGEKGINLSGGQKQRVSLARAVYSEANLYLMDDPLSAVDVHVGKHLFDRVIGPKGMLRNKTRILVTHRVSVLPQVDMVVVMQNGTISEIGTYKELLDKKGVFADFLMQYLTSADEERDDDDGDESDFKDEVLTQIGSLEKEDSNSRLQDGFHRGVSRNEASGGEKAIKFQISREKSIQEKSVVANGMLTAAETSESGRVKWTTYFYYFRSIGLKTSLGTLFLYASAYGCSMGSNMWLSIWSNDKLLPDGTQDIPLRNLRLGVYAALGLSNCILTLFSGITLIVGTTKAARRLHSRMLDNILRGPMSFFDTTPLGRIVNRFSKDIDVVDLTIPQTIQTWLMSLYQVLTTILVITIGTPIFLAAAVPLFVLYYFIQRFYVATSRQLKRLESISRSPIYSHFSESVTGSAVIRAFGRVDSFVSQSDSTVDENQCCYYPSIISNRWIGMRLELIGNLLVFCAALFAVLGRSTLNPGIVGLTVSYALSITFLLNWVVRMTCELETNIVAVERIREYTLSPTEAEWEVAETKQSKSWPVKGEMAFNNYSTRYRPGLDLVLKKVSFNIRDGEKVGIVGRTGAGKSSMTLGLFRIIESAGGSIFIDGVDIATLGLHDLRSRLTIIPQDPVLFSGTLRMNLDPFDSYSDNEVWRVLELSHLKTFVSSLSETLLHEISEGGTNLSVGQRQLVCLARALLRKTKILVLDEATAAVDLETDDLIQATIRKEFAECTVLTIAHRINTILDNDRIMVLSQGIIKEFDSPRVLLQNKSSIFYSMAKDAGVL